MKTKLDKTDYSIRTKATNSTAFIMTKAYLEVAKRNIKELERLADEEFLARLEFDRKVRTI